MAIANIIMGIIAYGDMEVSIRVLYGLWVGIMVFIYILFLPARLPSKSAVCVFVCVFFSSPSLMMYAACIYQRIGVSPGATERRNIATFRSQRSYFNIKTSFVHFTA